MANKKNNSSDHITTANAKLWQAEGVLRIYEQALKANGHPDFDKASTEELSNTLWALGDLIREARNAVGQIPYGVVVPMATKTETQQAA